jgi:L,D-peptidoglycan transpeptidase YkuD (ErfK/YbiS/YcfS/YnhG family)
MRLRKTSSKVCRNNKNFISVIHVRHISKLNGENRTYLQVGATFLKCQIGREGLTSFKREGDLKTPKGSHRIIGCYFRKDRVRRIRCNFSMTPTRTQYIWCDDEHSFSYNTFRFHSTKLRHERLWREDHQYNFCLILDYNFSPKIRGRGSAIFFHVQGAERYTAGCIAVDKAVLEKIMPRLAAQCIVMI